MSDPADVQAAFATTLVDEWVRGGVTDAVVAPGSRSTPLLVALADDDRVHLHVVLDERSAGFVALGLGLATGRPAPVVTTSGTAAAELHPSVVEAHQADVPYLAVTADRPPELHHVGAAQTVEQDGLFGGAVRWAAAPGVADEASSAAWRPLAARSVAVARGRAGGGRPGPVHLNVAFRDPLLGDGSHLVPAGRDGGAPWHRAGAAMAGAPAGGVGADGVAADGVAADGVVAEVVAHLARAAGGRGLLVAGGDAGDPDTVVALAAALGWPLVADPRSGARQGGAPVIAAADALLRVPTMAARRPEIVLRLGRPWASKVLNQWLASGASRLDVLVDPYGTWADPDRRVTHVVGADPTAFCRAVHATLVPAAHGASAWLTGWLRAEAAAQAVLTARLEATAGPPTEPAVARRVVAAAPAGSTLVTSSSMPVRDVEWFGAPRSGVRVVANRGANGIDGVVSTVLGVALAGGPVIGLLGDLAFAYDAGALLWARDRPVSATLVVVDNDGGGIFSFLPQAAHAAPARFEQLWGTPHGLDVGRLAEAYGVTVLRADDLDAVSSAVADAGRPGIRVVVVRTDRSTNVAVHQDLNAAVAAAVG